MKYVNLIFPRYSWSFNGPDGLLDVPFKADNSEFITPYKLGDSFVCDAGAPGMGRVVYYVTKIDEDGIWGYEIENTIREMEP